MKRLFTEIMKSKKRKFLICLTIMLAVLTAGILYGRYSRGESADNAEGLTIAEDTQKASSSPDTSSQGIQIPGYSEIKVDHSTGTAQIDLLNPEGNACLFQYTLQYTESSETIYSSDLIEPGRAVSGFQLEKMPDKGKYNITISVHTYSNDKKRASMNGAEIQAVMLVA